MSKAAMPLATSAKLYLQHLGMDVLVKNTFIEFAKESEPQCPARAGRHRSCPPRAGGSPAEPGSAERRRPSRHGRRTCGKSPQGSSCADEEHTPQRTSCAHENESTASTEGISCADEEESSASTEVPAPSSPETPKGTSCADEDESSASTEVLAPSPPETSKEEQQPCRGRLMCCKSPQGSSCADEESSASTGVPSPGSPEMPNDVGAKDEALLMSIGSRLHAEGSCKPCIFYIENHFCKKGQDCAYCHMPHDAPKWKRERAPKFVRQRIKKKAAAAAPSRGGSAPAAGPEDMMDGVGGRAACHPSQPFSSTAHEHGADSTRTPSLIPGFAGRPRMIVSL